MACLNHVETIVFSYVVDKMLHTFSFWGINFGNCYRELYSMIFLGEVINLM